MTTFAIVLVLASAVLHATWNLFAKQANGGTGFVWLFSLVAALVCLPLALLTLAVVKPAITNGQIVALGISCTLHIAYYFALDRGYRKGDLSLVYPLSRGAGPALATVGAVLLFGERPTLLTLAGTALIVVGVFILTGNMLNRDKLTAGIAYGLLAAFVIALYTLSDKIVVTSAPDAPQADGLAMSLLLIGVSSLVRTLALLPFARQQWETVRTSWRDHRRAVLGVGLLDPLSYTLFLMALATSKVSYLAPARQVSILIGAFIGTRLLSEGQARRRMIAAGVMLVGLVALTLS